MSNLQRWWKDTGIRLHQQTRGAVKKTFMKFSPRFLFAIIIVSIAITGLLLAFELLNPTPPRTVIMSTGPEGSAYAVFAEQYREHLASNGVSLELRSSGGAAENLDRLNDPNGDVDIAFITMGSPGMEKSTQIRSLGAMFFEPLWFFAVDPELARGRLGSVQDKRLSIGPDGSRSNSTARGLLRLRGVDLDLLHLLALDPADAVSEIKAGTIDAIFIVTYSITPVVQELLAAENVTLVDFKRASAYAALYPQIKKLTVPAGVGDLAKNLPPEDVNILAFTTILAVRGDLHPAIQSLFLNAASQIHAKPDLFHADGSFPSELTFRVPLSSSASRYYKSGQPFLHRFLPFWLAVLVMQLLVAALPLIGIVYPALKLIPSVFSWLMRRRIFRLYGELRHLESRLGKGTIEEDKREIAEKLDDLDRRVRNLKVPVAYSNLVFALRMHVDVVRARLPIPD
jgi:TRAP-type uncharacterized transport system substrate-binding protein